MNIEEYDEEDLREMRSLVFNSKTNLLNVLILLEAFDNEKTILTLQDFIKGDYWDIEEIYEEIREQNDYGSTQDLILEQVLSTVDLFQLGKIESISVIKLNEFLQTIVREAIETKATTNELEDTVLYYTSIIEKIGELKALSEKYRDEAFEKNPKSITWHDYYNQIKFTPHSYSKDLVYIVHAGAPFIEIEIEFHKNGIENLKSSLNDYLLAFSQDAFISEKENRLYFSKQLENFLAYINKLPLINSAINVPFEVLNERGFEFVKIASYLESKNKLKVRRWGDKHIWNIKFHTTPITINSLIASEQIQTEGMSKAILKSNLSFNEANSTLTIGNSQVKLRKGSDPYHLLRIIFEDKDELSKEWFYSEISEKYDVGASFDDKKFYNASYQVKQKIAQETTLKDVLITTAQSVRINPNYLS
jgi:hypothetical protein